MVKRPTDQKPEQDREAQTRVSMYEIQPEAEKKNLAMKEEQMKNLDKEKEEVLRIFKNASEKKHPGKCLAFRDQHIDADRTILAWRALGFTVTSEVSNTALSVVNSAISIAKAVPSVIGDIARPAGNLGTFGSSPMRLRPNRKPEAGQKLRILLLSLTLAILLLIGLTRSRN